jgi:hypothetical protein
MLIGTFPCQNEWHLQIPPIMLLVLSGTSAKSCSNLFLNTNQMMTELVFGQKATVGITASVV